MCTHRHIHAGAHTCARMLGAGRPCWGVHPCAYAGRELCWRLYACAQQKSPSVCMDACLLAWAHVCREQAGRASVPMCAYRYGLCWCTHACGEGAGHAGLHVHVSLGASFLLWERWGGQMPHPTCPGARTPRSTPGPLTPAPTLPQHLSTASGELQADASFMQTLWNMNPICSGCEEGPCPPDPHPGAWTPGSFPWPWEGSWGGSGMGLGARTPVTPVSLPRPGYVTGGHVMRLFHGHMDECLTISSDPGDDQLR